MRSFRLAMFGAFIALMALPSHAAELVIYGGDTEQLISLVPPPFDVASAVVHNSAEADRIAATFDAGSNALRAGNPERAYALWVPLAQAGNCRAQFAVGHLIDPRSANALPTITRNGRPVSESARLATAAEWYRLAAEEGWPAAQLRIAEFYAQSAIYPADPELAVVWYRRAARMGEIDAMQALARHFLAKASTAQQLQEGLFWALVARDSPDLWWVDDGWTTDLVDRYRERLPAAEVATLRVAAASWRPLDAVAAVVSIWATMPTSSGAALPIQFYDLEPADASPAAAFDTGVAHYLRNERQAAFDLLWPLALDGHCFAQAVLGSMGTLEHEVQWPKGFERRGEDFTMLMTWAAALQGQRMAQYNVLAVLLSAMTFSRHLGEDVYEDFLQLLPAYTKQEMRRWAWRSTSQGYSPACFGFRIDWPPDDREWQRNAWPPAEPKRDWVDWQAWLLIQAYGQWTKLGVFEERGWGTNIARPDYRSELRGWRPELP